MKNPERYRHLRVDWVGQSITLCGVEGEDIGAGQALCPDCAQVGEALNVCGLGPESLRELKKIKLAWPELNYSTAPGVLILLPSVPTIAPLNQGQLGS